MNIITVSKVKCLMIIMMIKDSYKDCLIKNLDLQLYFELEMGNIYDAGSHYRTFKFRI